jgi:16S rRNA (cytosine1402-N4)-methyltransferase
VTAFEHEPVLTAEVVEGLAVVADGWYVDATYGRGGHSAGILAGLGERGRVLALDKDPEAVAHGRERFANDARFSVRQGDFACLRELAEPWLQGRSLAGVVLDLGVSSPQLETPDRGFSFATAGPLDMRMNPAVGVSAAEWLARAKETEIAEVLRRFGEEPRARALAARIVAERAREPITTTTRLADIVSRGAPRRGHRHPATLVFQALRIKVNGELESLAACLPQAVDLLEAGGRLCVVSFHSLEDRLVKQFMALEARGDPAYAGLPTMPPAARPRLKRIGRMRKASAAEIERNPRARSARLRVAEKLAVAT